MFGVAAYHHLPADKPQKGGGTAWASVIAILFAVIAAISFAVEITVSLSGPPAQPARVEAPSR